MGNATSHELPSTRRLRKRMAPAFSCEPDYKTKFIPHLMFYLINQDSLNQGLLQNCYDFQVTYSKTPRGPQGQNNVAICVLDESGKPVHQIDAQFRCGVGRNRIYRFRAYFAMWRRILELLEDMPKVSSTTYADMLRQFKELNSCPEIRHP